MPTLALVALALVLVFCVGFGGAYLGTFTGAALIRREHELGRDAVERAKTSAAEDGGL